MWMIFSLFANWFWHINSSPTVVHFLSATAAFTLTSESRCVLFRSDMTWTRALHLLSQSPRRRAFDNCTRTTSPPKKSLGALLRLIIALIRYSYTGFKIFAIFVFSFVCHLLFFSLVKAICLVYLRNQTRTTCTMMGITLTLTLKMSSLLYLPRFFTNFDSIYHFERSNKRRLCTGINQKLDAHWIQDFP